MFQALLLHSKESGGQSALSNPVLPTARLSGHEMLGKGVGLLFQTRALRVGC